LMLDPNAAMGAVIHDRAPLSVVYDSYIEYMRRGHEASGKPVFLVSNRQGTGADPKVVPTTREGFPILDGVRSFLTGVRCMFNYRDFQARKNSTEKLPTDEAQIPEKTVTHWLERLGKGEPFGEFESGQLLRDFGISTNAMHLIDDEKSLMAASESLAFPLVLKTAKAGVLHKTDQNGVVLNLENEEQLKAAYADISNRLGPLVLLSPMVKTNGVEMVLGLVTDDQFGPLVMLGFGGINVEVLNDVVYALPPFSKATASRLLDTLVHRPLLNALRNRPALDIDAYCQMAASFSLLASRLGDVIEEIDINPVIVNPKGCLALDALVVGRSSDVSGLSAKSET
jgi:acyl-CoA synthetase (NDP forming)